MCLVTRKQPVKVSVTQQLSEYARIPVLSRNVKFVTVQDIKAYGRLY
jgi:hypothetical protein